MGTMEADLTAIKNGKNQPSYQAYLKVTKAGTPFSLEDAIEAFRKKWKMDPEQAKDGQTIWLVGPVPKT